ncbi:MAG: plasmid mobilization relaxosome protein MobC, partial [Erysipelotrichaceae bacterium]|nr:plasmid mobilization relaxosome protein MobC [Erysipelotrichaceae bacterium]
IARLIYEIRKIGVNINQIAHVANGQGFILQSDLVTVKRQMDAVFEITKKIVKATYDEKEANIKTLERKIDKLMERVDANGDG